MNVMISFIIPVFNCKNYLENCVKSVCNVSLPWPNLPAFEVILVDDGSSDGSTELCDRLSETLTTDTCTVRAIHQENQGVSAARNAGLRVASGTYVQFVDADDKIDSEGMSQLLQMLAEDPSPDMVIFGISFDYFHKSRQYRSDILLPPLNGIVGIDTCNQNLFALFSSNALSALWNKLIRRERLLSTGLCLREDMFLYEDLEFSLRALACCRNIFFCQKAIYHYRQPEDEGNAGRRLSRIAHIPQLLEKIETALEPFGEQKHRVLLSLHLVLAREKIGVSEYGTIKVVCEDFKAWIDFQDLFSMIGSDSYALRLYHSQISRILINRAYSGMRHRAANWVKQNFGDFRK